MARKILAIALVLFFVVELASAAGHDAPKDTSSETAAAPAHSEDSDTVGNIDGDDSEFAPVGGPVPDGAFSPTATAAAPGASGAAALEISSIVGGVAAAVAAAGFFF
ncbi:hypothetical protein ACSBR1_036906 [Camellia fascicularis]